MARNGREVILFTVDSYRIHLPAPSSQKTTCTFYRESGQILLPQQHATEFFLTYVKTLNRLNTGAGIHNVLLLESLINRRNPVNQCWTRQQREQKVTMQQNELEPILMMR